MCFSDVWVGNGGWVLVVSFFAMGFDFGMGVFLVLIVVVWYFSGGGWW